MGITSKKITKIVCIGDSITEGFGLGADPSVYYPTALKNYLGPNVEVHNKGVTSSCVINTEVDGRPVGLPYILQPKYAEALNLRGDIYIVMLGTNDASDGYDPATGQRDPHADLFAQFKLFEPCYQSIIDRIKSINSSAKIYLVAPIPIMKCIWPKHKEKYLVKLIPIIKKLAKDNNVSFIDLHKEFQLLPEDQLDKMYQKDGLHPSILGAMVIASLIAGYVKVV